MGFYVQNGISVLILEAIIHHVFVYAGVWYVNPPVMATGKAAGKPTGNRCMNPRVVRSSFLHNGISYTGKMSSLYWIGA